MDIAISAEDEVFREEVRGFLRDAIPPELRYKVENGIAMRREDVVGWHKILYEKGWVAPNWPREYGGPGWSVTQNISSTRNLVWPARPGWSHSASICAVRC